MVRGANNTAELESLLGADLRSLTTSMIRKFESIRKDN